MAQSLEDSARTSIAARLAELQGRALSRCGHQWWHQQRHQRLWGEIDALPARTLPGLLSEAEISALPEAPLMPFDLTSGFAGGAVWLGGVPGLGRYHGPRRTPKQARGHPASTPPLLSRLGMDAEAFIASADHFFKDFASPWAPRQADQAGCPPPAALPAAAACLRPSLRKRCLMQ